MDGADLALRYYDAIDSGDYDGLRALLDAEFTHDRPDRDLAGADRFVAFMREERPDPDTTHAVDATFERDGGVAVQGRLLRADDSLWFEFVDVFTVADGALTGLTTYTR